ncbi:MAG TPA: diaminopimelate decarboxylase [Dongiaceae bacterium]
MSYFPYRGGTLHAEEVPLDRLAAAVGTPFYCYSSAALIERYQTFIRAFDGARATICYSLKANSNQAVIATFARLGAGADVVSEGEMRRALAAGVPPERIVFAGVGKGAGEMIAGLEADIQQFNVESLPELELLDRLAQDRGKRARVALRVNPDVDARTHKKIATGKAENKFGIDLGQVRAIYARASGMAGIEPVGLAVHIGSQLLDLAPYRSAFAKIAALVAEIRADGHRIESLDLGGGIGIAYRDENAPAIEDYVRAVQETVGNLGCQLFFEPGRWMVGHAGILVTRVLYVKQGAERSFVITDAAMNDLIRPTLYDAYHPILPVAEPGSDAASSRFDVVGPICETGDFFAHDRPLPPLKSGDLLAIASTGAYGAVMSSTYNSRPLIPEVMVQGTHHAIVRARPSYHDMIALDRLPDWM